MVIATSSKSHGALIKKALNAGKHVLVQKPMTASIKEAEEALDLAEKKG